MYLLVGDLKKRFKDLGLRMQLEPSGKEPKIELSYKGEVIGKEPAYMSGHDDILRGTSLQRVFRDSSEIFSEYLKNREGINIDSEKIKAILKEPDKRKRKRAINNLLDKRKYQLSHLEQAAAVSSVLALVFSIVFVVLENPNFTGAFIGANIEKISLIPLALLGIAFLLIVSELIIKKIRKSKHS